MYYSYLKLKKLANLNDQISIDQVAKAMTSIGFEVEGWKKFTNLDGLKFAKVKKVERNINSDNLFICSLETDNKNLTIQTTAKNVKEGMIVIAFVPGSKIGNNIFDSKEIKGVISEGMLTSLNEFGIDEEFVRDEFKNNIIDYSSEINDIKIDPINYLELDDFIIEVDILSNRSDAASYYIMAKELAAFFNTKAKVPSIKQGVYESNLKVDKGNAKSFTFLEADVEKITIKEQVLLAKHNIKSINDAADLTNLTLIHSGQPTHAYDSKENFKSFTVSNSKDNKTIKVFGDKEVTLNNDQVVFADNKIVSIASVIGLEDYATSPKTKKIILEMGIFDIKGVRKAVKSVKLNTQSSSQGSKVLSIGTTKLALSFLTNRLKNFSNPVNFIDGETNVVEYKLNELVLLAGFDITKEQKFKTAKKSLESLGFIFKENNVFVPSYRHDVHSMQDILEELFRFYGYNSFKPKTPLIKNYKVTRPLIPNIKRSVSASGYQEVRTYSLISSEKNIINPFNFKNSVKLETFVSKAREVIRNSQAISLIDIADYNIKRGMKDLSFFSLGMVNDGFKTVAGISTIKKFEEVKKDITNLVGACNFERLIISELHPGVSAKIIKNGKMIGWIGKIHPQISKIDAFIWELNIDFKNKSILKFKEYKDKPLKFRDINIIGNNDIGNTVAEMKEEKIFDIKVIDEYISPTKERKVTLRIIK